MKRSFPPLLSGPAEGAVVVGVGLDSTDTAIRFAAAEACLADRPLRRAVKPDHFKALSRNSSSLTSSLRCPA